MSVFVYVVCEAIQKYMDSALLCFVHVCARIWLRARAFVACSCVFSGQMSCDRASRGLRTSLLEIKIPTDFTYLINPCGKRSSVVKLCKLHTDRACVSISIYRACMKVSKAKGELEYQILTDQWLWSTKKLMSLQWKYWINESLYKQRTKQVAEMYWYHPVTILSNWGQRYALLYLHFLRDWNYIHHMTSE